MAKAAHSTAASRRLFLASGTVAAVFGGLRGKAVAQGGADRFTAANRERLRLGNEINPSLTDEEVYAIIGRQRDLDNEALAMRPVNLAEVVGCLEYARRDHVFFRTDGDEDGGNLSDALLLPLIDGALSVLRPVEAPAPSIRL